ncbi:MAG: hypothetical protein JWR85_3592 [Marmoricola sp.]|nr:hypothetical protein [Marmoricola sp.]
MPPVIIGAGIAAVGAVAGGVISSSATKSAAKSQATTAANQVAESQRNQQYITGLEQPTIDRGNAAGAAFSNFMGLNGAGSQQGALDTFRASTGYQDTLNTGLGAVNSNAYSRGLGASGATLKALQARGSAIADQSSQQYLGNLNVLNQTGQTAIGNVAGVATNTTNSINSANQNAANASSNASLANGASWTQALQNIANVGGSALASSYGSPSASASPYNTPPINGYATDPNKINVWGR